MTKNMKKKKTISKCKIGQIGGFSQWMVYYQ